MKKAYFFVNPLGPPKAADYQHCVISFAEGLKELGIHIDANINYYKMFNNESNNSIEYYLFNEKTINNIEEYNKYDIIVTGYTAGIPKNIIKNKNRTYKTIMLDWSDGLYTHIKKNNSLNQEENYDLYFITSYNKDLLNSIVLKTSNVYPLAFSLTHRIIDTIQTLEKNIYFSNNDFSNKKYMLLYSHRINHYIRHFLLNIYKQYNDMLVIYNDNFNHPHEGTTEYNHWHQSGRRHSLNFYNTLLNTKICDCTGGYMFRANNNKHYAYQVDSFKLWEAFASGCAVITIDFDKYNIQLPHQPINGVHYIGVTNNEKDVRTIINKIKNGEIDIETIAREGKKWALEHYSPKGIATYILNTIENDINGCILNFKGVNLHKQRIFKDL